jgi:hypothetical protein
MDSFANNVSLGGHLQHCLQVSGISSETWILDYREVVIFGSRAAGVHRRDSDLDVLIVGENKPGRRIPGLDIVHLLPKQVESSFWLGSELASHIAKYGKWLKSDGDWTRDAYLKPRAVQRKQQRVLSLLRNAEERWLRLHPIFQKRYATTIRRELLRLGLLQHQVPVPPTAALDSQWNMTRAPHLFAVAAEYTPQYLSFISRFVIRVH